MSGMTSKKWCFKANINIRRNELDEAIKCYDRAIQIDPTNLEAYIEKGNVFLNQKKLDQAANIYKKCLDIKPDFDIALSNLGTALSHQSK
jgi:tetratricopeptide (TPR) repeat protein